MFNRTVGAFFAVSLIWTLSESALPAGPGTEAGAGAIVAKIESTARSLHGFHCKEESVRTYNSATRPTMTIKESLDVTFERPNLFLITSKESNEPQGSRNISDGKNVFFDNGKIYSSTPISRNADDFHWYHNDLLLLLVEGSFEKALELPVKPKVSVLPDEDWNGESYHVLDMALGGGFPIDYKVYVGSDNIVRRVVHTEDNNQHPFIEDFMITYFEADPQVHPASFHFAPAPGQKTFDRSAFTKGQTPLISVGKEATPFSLPTPDGSRLTLSEALAGKKALLLNFWFVHCPPCRAEHPKLEQIYKEFKDQGFDILSVDDQDAPQVVAKYWKGVGLTFRTVLSGPRAAMNPKTGYPDYNGPKLPDWASLMPYGIQEYPTNVLLNAQGEVVYVATGWDEAGLRNALEQLGIK